MKILALETSAKAVSAAVVENGKVLCSGYQDTGLTHSRTLMPIVEHILKNTGMTMAQIDAVAVAAGPGSFTGIRIGVSAAKGLAFAIEKPTVSVSVLAAMARNVAFRDGLIICAMDARRNQVYNAIFLADGGSLTRMCEDRAIALADLKVELEHIDGPVYLVGDGAALAYKTLSGEIPELILPPEHCQHQRASGVALAALDAIARGETGDGAALQPNYLRLSQAERERMEKLQAQK